MPQTIRERDFLLNIHLEVDIFRISCRPTCKGEKGCVPFAFVPFAGAWPDYMSPSTISHMSHWKSMFGFNFCPNVNKSWPSRLIIMSSILDLVAGL